MPRLSCLRFSAGLYQAASATDGLSLQLGSRHSAAAAAPACAPPLLPLLLLNGLLTEALPSALTCACVTMQLQAGHRRVQTN